MVDFTLQLQRIHHRRYSAFTTTEGIGYLDAMEDLVHFNPRAAITTPLIQFTLAHSYHSPHPHLAVLRACAIHGILRNTFTNTFVLEIPCQPTASLVYGSRLPGTAVTIRMHGQVVFPLVLSDPDQAAGCSLAV